MGTETTEEKFILDDLERTRQRKIKENKIYGDSLHALACLEGLLEISEPIDAVPVRQSINQHHETIDALRFFSRKFNDKMIEIEFREGTFDYLPHNYYAEGRLALLPPKDSQPFIDITTLTFSRQYPNMYIRNVDDAICLLQIYKEVVNSAAYKKRLGQK